MILSLKQEKKVVGTKQVIRSIESNEAVKIFIAKDADSKISEQIVKLCNQKSLDIIYVETMKELGKACGIDVSAASAAIIK